MSDDRISALEKLGFVWNSHDAVWEERLKELSQYRNIFGDTNVPSNYQPNPKLAIWVKRQRRQHKFLMESKPSTMTPNRVDKLEEIGFTWSGRKPKKALKKETWEKKCDV
jgi:Helicase associated domain